jgi:glutamyl-Q tRNA(Asp) synthetase
VNNAGEKLSKQTLAEPISKEHAPALLFKTLQFLGQNPPAELANSTVPEAWDWTFKHWDLNKIPSVFKLPAS